MVGLAAAALRNAGLVKTTGVPRQTTGVQMTIDLSNDADSDDEGEIPRTANQGLAADSDSDNNSDDENDTGSDREPAGEQVVVEDVDENDPSEADDGVPATPPLLPEMLGRGMRIRRKP